MNDTASKAYVQYAIASAVAKVSTTPGPQGPQGVPGPNNITTSTTTNITGWLRGNGSTVEEATPNAADVGALALSYIDIHNGNFLSPVNQFAIASGATCSTADKIYLDRWRLVSGSFVWTSATGIALNGVVKQRIEALPSWLYSKEFPFTISIGGTEYRDTLTWPSTNTGTAASVTKNGVTIEIGFESYPAVLCGVSSTYTPYVKLTTSASTTINYIYSMIPPENFNEQLATCQRFYEKSYAYTVAPATSATTLGMEVRVLPNNTIAANQPYGTIAFKVKKRLIAPTITVYPFTTTANTSQVSNYSNGADLGANSGVAADISDGGFVVINGSGGALTTSLNAVAFHWAANAEL